MKQGSLLSYKKKMKETLINSYLRYYKNILVGFLILYGCSLISMYTFLWWLVFGAPIGFFVIIINNNYLEKLENYTLQKSLKVDMANWFTIVVIKFLFNFVSLIIFRNFSASLIYFICDSALAIGALILAVLIIIKCFENIKTLQDIKAGAIIDVEDIY
ncbi:hypothetical protein LJB88_05200 [Erysipelotrichaceae bacterium OttesenSCG-928-M19]|nr:hypothetical protein [Erysipelotrichaceae bacterium OttesenSCG-928-M19]